MKLASDFIINVFILMFISIVGISILLDNNDYNKSLKDHYNIVNKIQENDYLPQVIDNSQNDKTTIIKESDNVYYIKTVHVIDIPIIYFHDVRIIDSYVYKGV
ncbi:MAG: hypothetical protein RR945_01485 [Erysipelotrichaceae bacterium]